MLAHNIFVLLLIPFTGLYALSQIWNKTTLTKVFVLGTCMLAVSASMFFWIPALVEKSLVPIDASSLLTESIHQFPTITQLLFSPFAFGYSYPSPVDSLSFSLGFVSVLSVCAVVIGAVTKRISLSRFQLTVLLLFLGSVMLMLPQAEIVWKAFPVLQYLQFPWRLLFVTALLGSYLTAFLFTHLQGKQVWFIVGVLLIAVIGTANKSVQTYLHHDDAYYYSFTQTSTVLDENKPNTFTFHSGDLAPQAPLFEHDAVVEIHRWNGSHHEYSVDAKQDQRVIEPTAYFPGWKTFVDGQEIDIQFDQADGRISYWLTAGKHSIKTVFTQRTPARLLGNTVSLLSFVIFGALLIWMKKYEKAVHHA